MPNCIISRTQAAIQLHLKNHFRAAFSSLSSPLTTKLSSGVASSATKDCLCKDSSFARSNSIITQYARGAYFTESNFLQRVRSKAIRFLQSRYFNNKNLRCHINVIHAPKTLLEYVFKIVDRLMHGGWAYHLCGSLTNFKGASSFSQRISMRSLSYRFYQPLRLDSYSSAQKPMYRRNVLLSRMLHGSTIYSDNAKILNETFLSRFKYRNNLKDSESFNRWKSFYFKRNSTLLPNRLDSMRTASTIQKAYSSSLARIKYSLITGAGLETTRKAKAHKIMVADGYSDMNSIFHEQKASKKHKKTKLAKTASQPRKSPLIKPVTKPRLQIDTSAHTQKLDKPSPRKSQIWSNDKHIPGNRTVLTINFNTNYGAIGISTPAVNKQLNSHDFATFMEQIQSAQKKKDLYLNRLFEHLSASPLNLIYVNLIAENNCIAVIFDSLSEAPDATTVTDLVLGWGIELDVISATVHGPIQADTATRNDGIVPYQNIVSGNPLLNQSVSSLDDLAMSPFNLDGSLDSSMYSLVVEEVVEPEALYNYEVNNFLNTLESTPRPRFTPYVPSSNLLFS